MNWNWLKYAALAIAPLVLLWGIWSFVSANRDPLPDALVYVDVMTGETTHLALGKIKTIPAPNSKGEFTLLPVERRDGKVYVIDRYKDSLEALKGDTRFKVDMSTLEVKGAK